MNLAGYLRYVGAFNSQDWELVHREFYAEDFQAVFPVITLTDAAESLAWFRTVHEAVFEVLVPVGIDIAPDGRTIVAELLVWFIALAETDAIPGLRTARKGDVAGVPMRATYQLDDDDRIARLDVIIPGPPVVAQNADGQQAPGTTGAAALGLVWRRLDHIPASGT